MCILPDLSLHRLLDRRGSVFRKEFEAKKILNELEFYLSKRNYKKGQRKISKLLKTCFEAILLFQKP